MPYPPDDDGLVPPLKVLRKRLNGVYREDLGFSGPTRRYVLMVALLVGLASVPTLAVITAGSNEINGREGPGAMDAPFLPPPVIGPIRPSPSVSPSPSGRPDAAADAAADAAQKDHSEGYADGAPKLSEPKRWRPRSVSEPKKRANSTNSKRIKPPPTGGRTKPAKSPRRPVVPRLPVVPGLPVVPEDVDVSLPEPPADLPTIPDLPEVPSDQDDGPSGRHGEPDEPDEPDEPHPGRRRPCEDVAVSEPWSRRRAAVTTLDAALHKPHSRRSAVTERPHNVRAARILERSYGEGGGNIRRSMSEPRSEEHRTANRPYRGQHRAENDEGNRSSRVGRHHADPR